MKKIFIALLGISLTSISAQQQKHTVAAKENPYAIAKKYGVSVEELLKQNPKIKEGKLNIGDVLIIPSKAKSTIKKEDKIQVKEVKQKLGKIYLQPKQTIYGITKQYRISEAELRRLNPDLDSHMKIGDEVVLPEENIRKYADSSAQKSVKEIEIPSRELEMTKQSGDIYTIQPKDTYYGIAKKFNLSQKELFALNPGLEEKGLQIGEVIKVKGIPSRTIAKKQESKIVTHSKEELLIHTVRKGDTAFGIINKYNISYDQLSLLNDGLPNGIQEGMELKIKKYEKQYLKVEDDVFNIALMLPFGFDSNDNKYRNLATDFLIGAKLVAERNVEKGKKISLNIVDAENENAFKNNLSQINKMNTDIIVGPFFKSNVLEVLNYVKEEKIPVVAPFAHASDLYDYSNLILVEPSNRVYAERITQEVKKIYANQKIYIIGNSADDEVEFIKSQLKRDFPKVNIAVVVSSSEVQLEQNMMTGQKVPAILILADNDDKQGRVFAQKLIELGKQAEGIKAFSMYYHSDFEKNIDALSRTNLVYLMDRKINTDGVFEKEILADFKEKYCRIPSKYMIIGFDVMNDILTREYKGDIIKQIEKSQTQLATKFEYIRVKKNGALVNTGYRVVRLIP